MPLQPNAQSRPASNGVSLIKRTLSVLFCIFFPALLLGFFVLVIAPYFVHADEAIKCTNASFCPLADVAGSKLEKLYSTDQNLVTYLNTLFKMAISVGAIAAVLRMVYAGYIYMASDVWTSKDKAKGIFRDVFLGLVLLLSIYIILSQINPNLLNLDPKLAAISDAEKAVPASSTAFCSDCVPIPAGVPAKPPGIGCKYTSQPCMVSKVMAFRLTNLAKRAISISWQVTEAYPPTVAHSGPNSCHNNQLGTCVDANFIGGATPQLIKEFLTAAEAASLTARWEVKDQARKDQLVGLGVPSGSILVTGNAEHFHITGG